MLVLARKKDEEIIITTAAGERIVVTMVEMEPHKHRVKIGVHAPRSVRIDRAEVDEKRKAAPALKGDGLPSHVREDR